MAPRRSGGLPRLPCLAAAALVAGAAGQDQVQHVDMVRAMSYDPTRPVFPVENNNLADIPGVLRYVMQEVLPELILAADRPNRKYSINAIGRYQMKVRNPQKLLDTPARQDAPGFGIYSAFDLGIFTNKGLLNDLMQFGDYVGAGKQNSKQIIFKHDYYWYSVTGVCPNLPWTCIKGSNVPGCTAAPPEVTPADCLTYGCPSKTQTPLDVCSAKYENFVDASDEVGRRSCCLHYADDPTTVMKGGLCRENQTLPTGQKGCVYYYEPLTSSDYAMLDDLAGITQQTCGPNKEPCKNWADWRKNCNDNTYKRKFSCKEPCLPDNPEWDVEIVQTDYCVEFDVHPYCQMTPDVCGDPRCMKLAPEQRDLGLPFWRGKCDPVANQKRAEAIAGALMKDAVKGTHMLVDPANIDRSPPCLPPGATSHVCQPNDFVGGPLCTRMFSGVCTPCFIPGTKAPFPAAASTSACPLGVLKEKGVALRNKVECVSSKPQDLCCLYKVAPCEGSDDPETATLDVDGFLLVLSKMNSTAMATFARRYLTSQNMVVKDEAQFLQDAYWLWDFLPPKTPEAAVQLWATAQQQIAASKAVESITTTTSTTTTTTTTTTTSTTGNITTTTTAAGGSGGKSGGGSDSKVIIIVVVVVVVVLVVLAMVFVAFRRNGAGGEQAIDENAELQMSRF